MAGNPKIKQNDIDFITPDLDVKKLTSLLATREARRAIEPRQNEFEGSLTYKVTGNKVSSTDQNNTISGRQFFEINHAVADPFRDPDVDTERMVSKGTVDRDTIEKRVVLFLQSDKLYQMLYVDTSLDDANSLATFLLRIAHKGDQKPNMDLNSKINFNFKDPLSYRDPQIIITSEKTQKDNPGETAQSAKPATS